MTLKNKTYDIIKCLVLVVLPALSAFVGTIGVAYGWEATELVVISLNAFAVFLGTATGVSAQKYKQEQEETK